MMVLFCIDALIVLFQVTNCSLGWDHILDGLLHVGFGLMSAFGPKQGWCYCIYSAGL